MTINLTITELTPETAKSILKLLQTEDNDVSVPLAVTETQEAQPVVAGKATESAKEVRGKVLYTIEDVRGAFMKYAKKNGKAAAKELLTKYAAARVTELKDSQYPNVMIDLGV